METTPQVPRNFVPTPFEYHEIVELEIDDITNLGAGVGRIDGWVVMVPFALGGERVKARIFRNKKNFSEGDLVEVVRASPQRVEPKCGLFGVCGGCQYQHLSYEAQLEWKRKQVRDLITRIGGIDFEPLPTHPSPKQYGYRSKLTPHYERARGEKFPIGFVKVGRRTDLVDVPQCPIASEAINAALPEARAELDARKAQLRRGGTILLRDTGGKVCRDNNATVRERVGKLDFEFVAGEFFQNNPFILPEFVEYGVGEAAGSKYLVDAYCGVGMFALSAADRFEKVAGVEVSEKAIRCAKRNAEINGITNCEFLAGKAENIFAQAAEKFSGSETSVIIDPPRSGCDESFLEQLAKFAPKKIVYVSCGPDTQARDIAILTKYGYKLQKLQPFDLFPQTRHIECVATLTA